MRKPLRDRLLPIVNRLRNVRTDVGGTFGLLVIASHLIFLWHSVEVQEGGLIWQYHCSCGRYTARVKRSVVNHLDDHS